MNRFVTALAGVALLSLAQPAQAADLFGNDRSMKDGPDQSYESPNVGWNGPWLAIMAGYGVLAQSEGDAVFGLEGAFGELQAGYDIQFGRGLLGAYGCVGYSAIEDLSTHYCLGVRGGILLTNATLLYVPVGWQWQHVDGEGEDGGDASLSGLYAGLGLETRLNRNTSLKVEATHQWVTDFDGNDISDENLADNRIKAGIVVRFGGVADALR